MAKGQQLTAEIGGQLGSGDSLERSRRDIEQHGARRRNIGKGAHLPANFDVPTERLQVGREAVHNSL